MFSLLKPGFLSRLNWFFFQYIKYANFNIRQSSNRPKALFKRINKLTKPPSQVALASDELCCSCMNPLLEKTDAVHHQCFSDDATNIRYLQQNQSSQSLTFFSLTPSSVSEIIWNPTSSSWPCSYSSFETLTSASFPLPLKTAAVIRMFLRNPTLIPQCYLIIVLFQIYP